MQATSAWSVKTLRAPSRQCRDTKVYGLKTTAIPDISTLPTGKDPETAATIVAAAAAAAAATTAAATAAYQEQHQEHEKRHTKKENRKKNETKTYPYSSVYFEACITVHTYHVHIILLYVHTAVV